jgi:hypothetical protein
MRIDKTALQTRTAVIAMTAALAPLLLATPAPAFPGHASCADEVHQTIVPLAQQGLGGELAPPLAQSHQLVGVIEANQAALCEPQP